MNVPLEKISLSEYSIAMIDLLIKSHEDFQKEIKEVLKAYIGKKPSDDLYNKLIDVAVKFDLKEIAESFYFSSLPYDPVTGNDGLYNNPAPPSVLHPLGTDPLGRDIMAEMMYSTPREFVLGVTAALITVVIGTLIGATAAYYGGAIDTFFMRLADIVMLFPSLALLMVLSAFIELTLFRLALIMGIISGFGSITIVLKAQALTVKVRPFIEAAKSAGGSNRYIITRHIIPNILPLSFLYMMFSVTGAIFSEATLSFFGLVQLKMSWGIILHTAQSQGYLIGSNIGTFWWLWVPPGAAITLICSAFYFLGRGLEEIVNPRLRSR
ncbi:MAG: ABC transporter permease [Thermotogaceae bacterium]|nr:ABC transporter permease [Thermotogaceae bacterium]